MPVLLSATLAEIEEAFAHEGGVQIEQSGLVGEETLTRFDCKIWFAVCVGDVLEGRYKVLGKVANGGSSTIWFVEDEATQDHMVLKISINYTSGDTREQDAFGRIAAVSPTTTHAGLRCLQRPSRQFTIEGESGSHQCFLMTPSACHVEEAWRVLGDFPLALTQEVLQNALLALDFLHSECKLIHTDIKLDNILFGFANTDTIAGYVDELKKVDSTPKWHEGADGTRYPVTKATPFVLTKDSFAHPQLNDLGESVIIPEDNNGFAPPRVCSPKAFRAPETLLGLPFNASIDVWQIGCMTLQLLTGSVPIKPHGPNQPWTETYTLAQHHALLGPPPKELIAKSTKAREYWSEDGQWIHPDHAIPDISLDRMLATVKNNKRRKEALDFVKHCLQWLPEDRMPAKDLAMHPFLIKKKRELLQAAVKKITEKGITRLRTIMERLGMKKEA